MAVLVLAQIDCGGVLVQAPTDRFLGETPGHTDQATLFKHQFAHLTARIARSRKRVRSAAV